MSYYDPYGDLSRDGRWLKAQFHLHHLKPPGTEFRREETADMLEPVFREYKAAGFEVVAQTSYRGWYDSAEIARSVGLRSFNGQQFREPDGILLIGTSRFHTGTAQEVVDACNAEGGFAIICHPNPNFDLPAPPFPVMMTQELAHSLQGVIGVEIYNGCLPRAQRHGAGFGLGLATDYWDRELSAGRRLWGFASDDAHWGHEINVGWMEVFAAADDYATVKDAVSRGCIVASRGLRLYDWTFDGKTLSVEADLPYFRSYETEYRFIGCGGEVLATITGRSAQYELSGDEAYVRVEARNGDGSILWTQPLLRTDVFGSA